MTGAIGPACVLAGVAAICFSFVPTAAAATEGPDEKGAWSAGPPLKFAGPAEAVSLPGGRVLRVGNQRGPQSRTQPLAAEVYRPGRPGSGWQEVRSPKGNLVESVTVLSGPTAACGERCGLILGHIVYNWQILDPETWTWSDAPESAYIRGEGATTTLLDGPDCAPNCGKVLAVGGIADYSPQGVRQNAESSESAELYDPGTHSWTPTGSLPSGRVHHAAISISGSRCGAFCGKVIIVGGVGQPLSAAVYDPASGAWSPAPAPTVRREEQHSLTGLGDGRVLVAGGQESGKDAREAEIFDPMGAGGAGAWTPAGECICAPESIATRLPDGTVLVAGGRGEPQDKRRPPTSRVEIYDPGSNTWSAGPPLNEPRAQHNAVVLDHPAAGDRCGSLLVAGGLGYLADTEETFPIATTEYFSRPSFAGSAECRPAPGGKEAAGHPGAAETHAAPDAEGSSAGPPGAVVAAATALFVVVALVLVRPKSE